MSPARRRKDRLARGAVLARDDRSRWSRCVLIIYYLLSKGLSSWSASFFTTDPTGNTFFGNANIGGIKSAILGTIEIVALASAISIPIGVGVAIWLVEYGKDSWFAQHRALLRRRAHGRARRSSSGCSSTSCSIIGTGSSYAGYKGSIALSLLMLPIVIRSAEVILLLVPGALRESALALGAPRWRVIFSVVLPTALPGHGHRRAARRRARRRRDRAAAVHRGGHAQDQHFNLEPVHELAACANL